MKLFWKIPIIILAILFLGCTYQQPGGNQTTGSACTGENQLCGYGTVNPIAITPNQSQFYGKCCEGYACVEGYCKKATENCVGNGYFCGYGPTNLVHLDNLTYYGECCEGDCQNGLCKAICKTSGSCNNSAECCSGLECMNGKCRTPCKTSGSCTDNLDCCSGYYCNASMQCAKVCTTSGPCTKNSDCCSSYFCGPNTQCIPEPKCLEHRALCNNTNQCCAGLTCADGTCANITCKWGTACNSTAECCTGLYCGQTGLCSVQRCNEIGGFCNTTDDCCLNRRCENNTCVNKTCALLNESCTSISCCSGLTCMNYKCTNPCKISGMCFKDSDCCSGYYCNPNGNCAKTATCIFEYANCTNSSQCCSGLECYAGTCSKPCKHTGPCASNADCCAGFFCNTTMQCTLQPTQSNYDLCERKCAEIGYNGWFCDPGTDCGMWGAHLTTGDAGCPTAYHDWSYPNNEYCCCENHTQYNCSSACIASGYANGWGTVSNPSKCGQDNEAIPVDGAVCCCYGSSSGYYDFQECGALANSNSAQFFDMTTNGNDWTQTSCYNYAAGHCAVYNNGFSHNCCWWNCQTPQQNWYCCHTDAIGYVCSQSSCPVGSQQISGPYASQGSCSSNCSAPQGECSIGTPQCGSECSTFHQSQLSVCGSGSCPTGYTQLTSNASCSSNPPCDRCCCQTSGAAYTQQTCQALSQSRGLTHSQLAPNGNYWMYTDCFNTATTHCHDYHNGGFPPSGGLNRNCCYWFCSDEQPSPPT